LQHWIDRDVAVGGQIQDDGARSRGHPPYRLGDMIGLTEWTAAILLIIGYFKPKAGIVGGIILVGMFFTTSTMLVTTPNDTVVVNGFHYMNDTGLFLFKDIISFGVAFYLISYYGRKAILAENQR
jgi:uncharacterized membrane protein YkgB